MSATPQIVQRRLLFFMRSTNYDRHFEGVLRELGRRGHHVHVVFDHVKKDAGDQTALFKALQAEFPNITHGVMIARQYPHRAHFAESLRLSIDYLRYLEADFTEAWALRDRAERRAPALLITGLRLFGGSIAPTRHALVRTLRAIEGAAAVDPAVLDFVHRRQPDAILVTPLVGLGSPQGDYIRAGRRFGMPTALLVASWDNLTNKGVIRDLPDLTMVWNEPQIDEAVELHGIPRETVVASGAHTYDHWFDWRPSTSREEFCAKVGLDPSRPFVLYVGSSSFIAPQEGASVRRWIDELQTSGHAELADVNILIRPHPANARAWRGVELEEPGRVAVWPRDGASPTTAEHKADYYDSIHHCAAVVGINTSAMIESAIVQRPVFTFLAPEYQATQTGTLHFDHLAGGGESILVVGRTLEQHHRQLAEVLGSPGLHDARIETFLRRFVRPRGLDMAAAPVLADAVEQMASIRHEPSERALAQTLLHVLTEPVALLHEEIARRLRWAGLRIVRPAPLNRGAGVIGRRLLIVLDHPGLLIHFDGTVRALLERGHSVNLVFGRPSKWEDSLAVLDLSSDNLRLEKRVPRRKDLYELVSRKIRAAGDYVHYLDPTMEAAGAAREKWRAVPHVPARIAALEPGGERRARALRRLAQSAERAIPGCADVEKFVERIQPDAVLVSPYVSRETYQADVVKAARRLRVPSAVLVASWDNLTSKGHIGGDPDRVLVWNETQRKEATELHGVPADRVVVTGAQQFDRWFDRVPSVERTVFCASHGIPSDRRYVLFAGSTRQSLAPGAEAAFVRELVEALRASDDPHLRDVAVLVRPHPTTQADWEGAGLETLPFVRVWRRVRPLPVGDEERDEYFDGIFHAAAVTAINSSAMIEAAIVGRPVHTVALPEFRALQRALRHYHYLLPINGGFLREALSIEEHLRLLANDLRDPEPTLERQRAFVEAFVRPPHGGNATDRMLAELESLAEAEPEPASSDRLATLLRPLIVGWAVQHRLDERWSRFAATLVPVTRSLTPAVGGRARRFASRRAVKALDRLRDRIAIEGLPDGVGDSVKAPKASTVKPVKPAKPGKPEPGKQPKVAAVGADEPVKAAKPGKQPKVAAVGADEPVKAVKPGKQPKVAADEPVKAVKPGKQPKVAAVTAGELANTVQQPKAAAAADQLAKAVKSVRRPKLAAATADQPAKPVKEPKIAAATDEPVMPPKVAAAAKAGADPTEAERVARLAAKAEKLARREAKAALFAARKGGEAGAADADPVKANKAALKAAKLRNEAEKQARYDAKPRGGAVAARPRALSLASSLAKRGPRTDGEPEEIIVTGNHKIDRVRGEGPVPVPALRWRDDSPQR